MHAFQLTGINHEPFEPLFELSTEQLHERGIVRYIADENPGFPCRISLEDTAIGDELLLLPYLHQPAASPYRASGPIFVRRGAKQRVLPVGEIPPYVTNRLISVRAYDAENMMISANVCEGALIAAELELHLSNDKVAYIQLHNAKRGCFSCQVNRA